VRESGDDPLRQSQALDDEGVRVDPVEPSVPGGSSAAGTGIAHPSGTAEGSPDVAWVDRGGETVADAIRSAMARRS